MSVPTSDIKRDLLATFLDHYDGISVETMTKILDENVHVEYFDRIPDLISATFNGNHLDVTRYIMEECCTSRVTLHKERNRYRVPGWMTDIKALAIYDKDTVVITIEHSAPYPGDRVYVANQHIKNIYEIFNRPDEGLNSPIGSIGLHVVNDVLVVSSIDRSSFFRIVRSGDRLLITQLHTICLEGMFDAMLTSENLIRYRASNECEDDIYIEVSPPPIEDTHPDPPPAESSDPSSEGSTEIATLISAQPDETQIRRLELTTELTSRPFQIDQGGVNFDRRPSGWASHYELTLNPNVSLRYSVINDDPYTRHRDESRLEFQFQIKGIVGGTKTIPYDVPVAGAPFHIKMALSSGRNPLHARLVDHLLRVWPFGTGVAGIVVDYC